MKKFILIMLLLCSCSNPSREFVSDAKSFVERSDAASDVKELKSIALSASSIHVPPECKSGDSVVFYLIAYTTGRYANRILELKPDHTFKKDSILLSNKINLKIYKENLYRLLDQLGN